MWSLSLVGCLMAAPALAQTSSAWLGADRAPGFPWGAAPFEPHVQWAAPGLVRLSMTIAPGQALEEEALHVQASPGWKVLETVWPTPEVGPVGQPVWRHSFDTWIQVQATQASPQPLTLDVQFQGCATEGVCHPPGKRQLSLGVEADRRPTLVVLSAPWCGPCKEQDQRMTEMEQQGRLRGWQVVRLSAPDGEAGGRFLQEYGVPGVPALRWYAPGEPVGRQGGHTLLGEQSKAAILAALKGPSAP